MGQSIRKSRKTNDDSEAGPSRNATDDAVGVVAANVEQTGEIFKLDIDCFEELFDYLSVWELVNVGKTCKRLQKVAGYYFQQNYSGDTFCESKSIRSNVHLKNYRVEHFAAFIQRIAIERHGFEYFFNMRSEFHRLKGIVVCSLERTDVRRFKEIPMGKVEVLRFQWCELNKNFHTIIDHCTKLKRLEIYDCKGSFDWLNRKYPTMEYLYLGESIYSPRRSWTFCKNLYLKSRRYDSIKMKGIPMCLQLNPNIRKFATNTELFWKIRNKFMATNVRLDDLAIYGNSFENDELGKFCSLLNALHQRSFYKKIQFYIWQISNQEQIDQLASVNGLVKLCVRYCYDRSFSFSALNNLEEISLNGSELVADLEMFANDLINLKRIIFERASIDSIMPFIRRSVEMGMINVEQLRSGVHFNRDTGIINLLALNREREQLPDARKITLYVQEDIYLATKWAMKETDFGLIRLKREEVYSWDQRPSLRTVLRRYR